MKQQFKTSEISRFFNVTPATVSNWINSGALPAYETIGGHYRIMRQDLIDFIKKRKLPLPDELKSTDELKAERYKILIVDDEKNVVESVKVMLENSGIDIDMEAAYDGFEAGVKVIQLLPHLVILDAVMPGANGDRVCRLIRNNEMLKDIKILVYTGYPEEGKKLFKLGADKVIEKFSKESAPDLFCREVCKLLGVKYRKVVPEVR